MYIIQNNFGPVNMSYCANFPLFSQFNFSKDVTITYILENQQRQRRFEPLPKRRENFSLSIFYSFD